MNTRSIIEMEESEHGLTGLGKIEIHHEKNINHKAFYYMKKFDLKIELNKEDSLKIFESQIVNDEIDVNIIYRFACDSCGITIPMLRLRTRKEEVVFARYLIFWYLNKYMKYSFDKSGKLLDKDHATAIHGVRIIDSDPKFLKEYQRIWRKQFMNKLNEHNLLNKK